MAAGRLDRPALRQFAQIAGKHLGQNVIIENKPGAGGMLGPVAM